MIKMLKYYDEISPYAIIVLLSLLQTSVFDELKYENKTYEKIKIKSNSRGNGDYCVLKALL